jgi:starvation-inducible outer membrane lipoprotein
MISVKRHVEFQSIPIRSYGDTSIHANTDSRLSKSKSGYKYAKKQVKVMGLVSIMLDNQIEQVCEVSSYYGDTSMHLKT